MLNPLPQQERVRAVFLQDESPVLADEEAAAAELVVELAGLEEAGEDVALRSNCFSVVGRPPGPHNLLFSAMGLAWKALMPDAKSKMPDVTKVERCMINSPQEEYLASDGQN